MTFPGSFSLRPLRRVVTPLALLAAATLLGACGGGTSQIEAFVAERLVVLGDETSTLTPDGRKYTVNGLTNDVVDCTTQQIWVQPLATAYGLTFAECNPNNVATTAAIMRAAAGARVADVVTQVDQQLAGDGVAGKTLATVLAGAHDVLDLYATAATADPAALRSQARSRGEALAAQVNRLVDAGARVIVSTVPDLGLTPYALAEEAANAGRAALLSSLTTEFNAGLRTQMLNDGRFVGLVLADEMVQAMARLPSAFGLGNVRDAACAVALPDCTTATLVTGADASTWLWADNLRLAFNGQNRLGVLALSRARNNPF